MFNLPNFVLRRRKREDITFVEPREVFKPMVAVVAKKDISGWANRDRKVKWSMSAGTKYYLDRETARKFMVKNYVYGPPGILDDVSDDERAEIMSEVTIIGMGVPNG